MKRADARADPGIRQANGIASPAQDLLLHATRTPLVPDQDPKLHCIRASSFLNQRVWTRHRNGLDEGPCRFNNFLRLPFRKLPCGAAIKMPIHKTSLVTCLPILLADDQHDRSLFVEVSLLPTISLTRCRGRPFIRLFAPAYESCRRSRQFLSLTS